MRSVDGRESVGAVLKMAFVADNCDAEGQSNGF